MATKRKSSKPTKKDLEAKIAELEAKLSQLSGTTTPPPKPAETKPTPPPKPAETKPTPPPKPAEKAPPKPAETAPPQKPVWLQWQDTPMGDWNAQKAKVTGYVSAPNRYYASKAVQHADVQTYDWNLQKVKVPGYTAPSNKYFATRAGLAYHPPDKRFGGFGLVTTSSAQTQSAPPPPPPPPKPDATLPKGSAQSSGGDGNSRKAELEAYEKDYLARLDQEQAHAEAAAKAAAEAAAKAQTSSGSSTRGSLPKGF